jgi:hypothetical protein
MIRVRFLYLLQNDQDYSVISVIVTMITVAFG